jgi:leishmanolysin
MSTSKIFFLTIALLLCFAIAESEHEHEHGVGCGHGVEEFNPDFLDIEEDTEMATDERLLASSGYPRMRIYSHFDLLKSGSSSFKSYIKYDLVPAVVDYLESALRIKYPSKGKLKVASNVRYVCGDPTPRILTTGVDADYFYYFTSGYDSGSFVATSTFCYLSGGTKRPIVSKVRFNINKVELPNGNTLTHEKNIYLVMHEMVHSLGFTQDLYKYYIDERGAFRKNHVRSVTLDGRKRKVLDIPALTSRVRKHFGCSSLPGAYLENNGDSQLTAGSHFERRHFLMDIMTSGQLNGRRLSEFTLAVLEGTGWYSPDYSYAEPNHFGAGQGCGFVNNKCSSSNTQFDEFCGRSGERGCFATGLSGGKCNSDSNSDGCRYFVPFDQYDCQNPSAAKYARLPELQVYSKTAGSKCFNGNLSKRSGDTKHSFCFTYSCVGSGSGTRLEVQVGNHKVVCRNEGRMSVPGYKGSIECPDPLSFCKTVGKKFCPRNCMGRGRCSNGKCVCNKGFKGADCSSRI